MRYRIGDAIGEYVITGFLGSGGSGDVFLVEHTITGRMEAMKILQSGIASERAERILREAKMQARLDHPNITSLHNAFWWSGDLALVMELVIGQSLRERMEEGPLDFETALGYSQQILRALNHAHRRQVIHRDITPSNILISENGLVKITDFGLAKEPADRRITQTGAMLGSLYYCSPEQVRSSGEVDHRTDIYSAAVVMYEMFTGHKPFEGGNQFEVMLAQTEQAPPPPSRVNPALPTRLDRCLLRAMEKDPEKRYWMARQFLEELEACERRPMPTVAYAAAGFLPVALVLGFVAWQPPVIEPEQRPEPPPMPSVAIRVPPIPLPPMNLPGLPGAKTAARLPEPAAKPAAKPAATPPVNAGVPKAEPPVVRRVAKQAQKPGPPQPLPVVIHAPGSEPALPSSNPAEHRAALDTPLPERAPNPAPARQPALETASDADRPGLLRGVARRFNFFRRRDQ